MTEVHIVRKWEDFLRTRYWEELLALAESDSRSLQVDFRKLDTADPELAEMLITEPAATLEAGRVAISEIGIDLPIDNDWLENQMAIRLFALPKTLGRTVRQLRDNDGGKLRAIRGLARVITDRSSLLVTGHFVCQRCGVVTKEPQQINRVMAPSICSNPACDRRGPMKLDIEKSERADYKKLILQDAPEEMAGFEQPAEQDVVLMGDLIEHARPGDRITVNGIVHLFREGDSPILESYIEAVSIEKENREFMDVKLTAEDKEEIRAIAKDTKIIDRLSSSIAPSIYGYESVKLSLALQLFSSDPFIDLRDRSRRRGDIHILLAGSPSTAKSQLLRFMARVIPGSVMTSGKGSSYAGLTAAAVKVDKEWQLSAGALVVANGSLCAVDEIGQMDKEQTSALHEAMESQVVHIAKAGIVAELPTACAVLAAENPKLGDFDQYEPIGPQINLPLPLVTRFDLIHIIMDRADEKIDRAIAEHILGNSREADNGILPFDKLQKYVSYARGEVHPVMTDPARMVLVDAYVNIRGTKSSSGAIPITVRNYQSIIRMSFAAARMRLSSTVDEQDALLARDHMLECLRAVGVDPETGDFDSLVLEMSTTKSATDRVKVVMDIITRIGRDSPNGFVDVDAVAEVAQGKGISSLDTNNIIDRLRRDGTLFSPRTGFVAVS